MEDITKIDTFLVSQRAYFLAGTAACREQDLANIRVYLDRLDRAERQKLIAECKKLGTDVVE